MSILVELALLSKESANFNQSSEVFPNLMGFRFTHFAGKYSSLSNMRLCKRFDKYHVWLVGFGFGFGFVGWLVLLFLLV